MLRNDWFKFNIATSTWSPIASMPCSPRQYCTAMCTGTKGYVFGGLDANGPLNELWEYDPSNDSWTQKTSLPAPGRFACVAVCMYTSCVLATGMMANNQPTNEAWKYDPVTDSWSVLNPVPGPPRHRAAVVDGAGLLVVGGADQNFAPLQDAWNYPIYFETGQWYPEPDLPAARYGADGGGTGSYSVVGGAGAGGVFSDSAWAYEGTFWRSLPQFPGGGRRGGVGAVDVTSMSMNMYYGLGLDQNSQRHQDWWVLDPVNSVQEFPEQELGVFPDPATDVLNLRWYVNSEVHVLIHDELGRVLLRNASMLPCSLSIGHLPSGVYSVSIIAEGRAQVSARWIKL